MIRQVKCRSEEVVLQRLWAVRRPLFSWRTQVLRPERTKWRLESWGKTVLEREKLRIHTGWHGLGIHRELEKGNSCQVRE